MSCVALKRYFLIDLRDFTGMRLRVNSSSEMSCWASSEDMKRKMQGTGVQLSSFHAIFLTFPLTLGTQCTEKPPPRNSLLSLQYSPRQTTSMYTTTAAQSSNMLTRILLSGSIIRVHILIGYPTLWTRSLGVCHLSGPRVSTLRSGYKFFGCAHSIV